ncbi:MAG: hypothetical protein ACKOZT_14735 [Cyanobium sp.]
MAFLLLIPLQGWAAWQSLERVSRAEVSCAYQSLERIAMFRKAVTSASSVAALQANLAAIQAPPLSTEDQAQGLDGVQVASGPC